MYLNEPAISVELADGVRNAPKVPHPRYEGSLLPDFGAMFAPGEHAGDTTNAPDWAGDGHCDRFEDDDCPNCNLVLTPRLADLLHTGAHLIEDVLRMGVEFTSYVELHIELDVTLPPPVIRHLGAIGELEAGRWLGSFIATIRTLAYRLEIGEVPYPRNTAEEMALHLAIEYADAYLSDTIPELPDGDDTRALYPATSEERDEDLGRLSDILFEDHDVLMLSNPALDGIEDPTSDAAVRLDLANLHARDWFHAFRPTKPVEMFAPPEPDSAVEARLGAQPDEAQVLEVAQRWLDAVAHAGLASVATRGENGDVFLVAVEGVVLSRTFTMCVRRHSTNIWVVHGLFVDDGRVHPVYNRTALDRLWVGAEAA